MKLQEFINIAIKELRELYDDKEATSIIYLLLAHKLNKHKGEIPLLFEEEIPEELLQELYEDIGQLKMNYPIQYLTNTTSFLDMELYTVEGVFIPRPETEELVLKTREKIMEIFGKNTPLRILEIGTGTGNIAIALARFFPNASIDSLDKSWLAVAVGIENAQKYGVLSRTNFVCKDAMKCDFSGKEYDVIISNPPYIPHYDYEKLPENVRKYEPKTALFAKDKKGLMFYEFIFDLAKEIKNVEIIAAEIYENHSKDIISLANLKLPHFKHSVEKDLNSKDRFYFGIKI